MPLALTALERLQAIPLQFWWKAALVLAAVILAVTILRKLAAMNKVVLAIIVLVVVVIGGFKMVYDRSEPAFLTPVVDKIAPFLPSKGAYATKQHDAPAASP